MVNLSMLSVNFREKGFQETVIFPESNRYLAVPSSARTNGSSSVIRENGLKKMAGLAGILGGRPAGLVSKSITKNLVWEPVLSGRLRNLRRHPQGLGVPPETIETVPVYGDKNRTASHYEQRWTPKICGSDLVDVTYRGSFLFIYVATIRMCTLNDGCIWRMPKAGQLRIVRVGNGKRYGRQYTKGGEGDEIKDRADDAFRVQNIVGVSS
ncbi:hypothetical protein F5146DRAFT_1000501 [Armillaria mellea]|nr:hypothetical protein F5146DRAFT_1000501 [Armillaria mellea]